MLKKYIADLKHEFSGYNAGKLLKDILSGITVAAVALPLALAFGVSSGADAAAGLVTAIIGGLVIGLLGGASFQISGPTGAMSAILIGIVAQYGLQGVFVASLAAGVIILLAGILRLGKLVNFIPTSVVMGFTSGIAIIIALGQVDNFFGTHSVGTSALEKLWSYTSVGFTPNWQGLLAEEAEREGAGVAAGDYSGDRRDRNCGVRFAGEGGGHPEKPDAGQPPEPRRGQPRHAPKPRQPDCLHRHAGHD